MTTQPPTPRQYAERVAMVKKGERWLLATIAAFVIGVTAIVTGCQNRTGADGYTFDRAEWINTDLRVRLVLHDSVEDLAREAKRAGADVTGEERVQAWGQIDAHGNCTLHIVDPRVRYMPEWIGHELTHCFGGRFHGAPVQ